MSSTTVSERLAALEAHYGVVLFNRTTRSISLTEEGRTLANGARNVLSGVADLDTLVRCARSRHSISSAPTTCALPGGSNCSVFIYTWLQLMCRVCVQNEARLAGMCSEPAAIVFTLTDVAHNSRGVDRTAHTYSSERSLDMGQSRDDMRTHAGPPHAASSHIAMQVAHLAQ